MAELQDHIVSATARLAAFVGAPASHTVMVENATSGIGSVLQSLRFAPGDRIVTTSQVYGAVRHTLHHVAGRTGAEIVEASLPLPLTSQDQILAAIMGAVDPQTRLVVADHVASPTALRFPVADIVAACHERDVPVLVDGSHGPGMLDLSVGSIGADWYIGNCHKWLCAPKGAAFMVVAEGAEEGLHPLAISHAYGKGFKAEYGKIGTRDASAWLCVPEAIALHEQFGGAALRQRNREVARSGGQRLATALNTELAGPAEMFDAMVTVKLPKGLPARPDVAMALADRLWGDHRTDALVLAINGDLWLRASVHAYNESAELDRLADNILSVLRAEQVASC